MEGIPEILFLFILLLVLFLCLLLLGFYYYFIVVIFSLFAIFVAVAFHFVIVVFKAQQLDRNIRSVRFAQYLVKVDRRVRGLFSNVTQMHCELKSRLLQN